jgi:hypothetical protein
MVVALSAITDGAGVMKILEVIVEDECHIFHADRYLFYFARHFVKLRFFSKSFTGVFSVGSFYLVDYSIVRRDRK